ncbi:MAG: cytidylyltransferase domain-containing protein [Anaerolineales bacterium]
MAQQVVALVPMRHHSSRVPGKNYRDFAGKPLYYHILETLLAVPEVETILVDTDSPIILAGLETDFPMVQKIARPEQLRGEMVSMNEILIHDTGILQSAYYFQTHSTNPLLTSGTISTAIQTFFDSLPNFDSLFSVSRLQTRLWDQEGKPINHDPDLILRTQDIPPIFEENSCMYIFNRETLISRHNRLGQHPFMYEIPGQEAWDIDEELDFTVAEMLYRLSHQALI